MPTCPCGHDHNIFIVEGDVHSCKTCGVCAYLREQEKAKPTNDDLLDILIEIVEQHVSPENSCRGCAEMGNPHYVHPKDMKECREQMSEAMKKWVYEIFSKSR